MKRFFFLFLAFTALLGCSVPENNNLLWPEITNQSKPWTRWWWMGNAVDQPNINLLLEQYAEAGFGGVEITPIYGAKGFEDDYIQYLSPEWMQMLNHTVKKASESGMQVDMNLGTGWPFGGPQITTGFAATRFFLHQYHIKAGEKLHQKIVMNDPRNKNSSAHLQALTGYGTDGTSLDLTSRVSADGTLDWTSGDGDWTLYALFTARTNQKVKRAAPGGEGLTFDHFSKPALEEYLKRFDEAFQKSNNGVRAFFNDSYEVYGTNWSDNFFEEFEHRRGYKLQAHLRELSETTPASELSHRVHCDYRETISDMLLENFTKPWSTWAHQYQSLTRNQAHGSPGNLLDLYAAVDIPECETFGSSFFPIPGLRRDSADIRNVDPDPAMMKFATSAANISGKKLVSSETFTWLGEHFKTSLAQCKPEVEQVLLSGVNHVFYHGSTYSPTVAEWPGWLFYASVNFTPENSFWAHLPALNKYIARCQSILQSGQPDNELLVYWPIHDHWMTTTNPGIMLSIHGIDDWLHPTSFYKATQMLTNEGYSYDFISDRLLEKIKIKNNQLVTENGTSYKALIFPHLGYLPEKTLEKVIELAKNGAHIVFQNIPDDVPGASNITARRQYLLDLTEEMQSLKNPVTVATDISKALYAKEILPETLGQTGLKFLRRKTGGGTYYYLVNHTSRTIDQEITLNEASKRYYILDPQTGETGIASQRKANGKQALRIQLRPGESAFVLSTNNRYGAEPWRYLKATEDAITIEGPWKLTFNSGGPELPEFRIIEELKPWTDLPDSATTNFSGTAIYSATFHLEETRHANFLLDLGLVYESARVWLNGVDAGYAWSIPFTIRTGNLLIAGENKIEIEVANLQANRIRWMDQQGKVWRNFHEINFVNINYQPFDASGWEVMPSGLTGPVRLLKQ